jgi:GNAT superfamily N-acetyltransferase
MQIAYLSDHPEFIAQIVDWHCEIWGDTSAKCKHDMRHKLLQHLNTKAIPITMIALSEKKCVGSVSLVFHDLDSHTHLSPWISYLYVDSNYRRKGIGTYLFKTILRKAKEIGCDKLYTYHSSSIGQTYPLNLINQIDLHEIEETTWNDEPVVILEISSTALDKQFSGK